MSSRLGGQVNEPRARIGSQVPDRVRFAGHLQREAASEPLVSPPIHRTMTRLEWSLLGILSVLWGGTFFFVAVAVTAFPPLTIVLLRVAAAALVLALAVRIAGHRLPRGRDTWGAMFRMSLLNNVIPFSLFTFAQTRIPGGLAAILNATTPLFAVVVAHVATADEKLTANRIGGVCFGFGGVAVMIGPDALRGLGDDLAAQLACLIGALSYAISGIQGRRIQALGIPPMVTATGQVIASTLLLAPIVALVDRPWMLPNPPLPVWLSVLALAVLSTALAYVLFYRILATAGATNLLLVTFLIPVSAILLGALLLGERLELRQLAGMALIGCGLAAIDGRLLTRLRAPPDPPG